MKCKVGENRQLKAVYLSNSESAIINIDRSKTLLSE